MRAVYGNVWGFIYKPLKMVQLSIGHIMDSWEACAFGVEAFHESLLSSSFASMRL
jgi:hypothetical protein